MVTPDLVVESAPAKVNLALHVTGRRADGYHDLESLMVFADVADELEARLASADRLTVTGPFAKTLQGADGNLVTRAISAFRERWPDHVQTGLDITLRKNLPVAAGLGGGSADAAAALRLMAGLGHGKINHKDLQALAVKLGADVPACLLSRPLLAKGIGEVLTPLADFPECYLVLVNPLVAVSTAEIFRKLAGRSNGPLAQLPTPMTRPVQLGLWLAETRNDLEPAAIELVPVIGELIARLGQAQGCILARMSGSGATVFGLFGSSAQAHQAAHELRRSHENYWVAAAPVIGVA